MALLATSCGGGASGTPAPVPPAAVTLRGASAFLLGVNYPYRAYGNDFGANAWGAYGVHAPATSAAVDADFARMAALGVTTVRWFVFADGRAGITFDASGLPTGLDSSVVPDLDAALQIAARHGLYLDLVLLDFLFMRDATIDNGVQLGGHADVINTPSGQRAFIDLVLTPLLRRYATAPALLSWEVMNEPEWTLSDGGRVDGGISRPATLATFRRFTQQVADAVHRETDQYVTVGSGSARWVHNWVGLDLDYYQVHYYDWMRSSRADDLYRAGCGQLRLDRPVVVGEFPAAASATASLTGYLDRWYAGGCAGAWAWSFAGVDRWGSPAAEALAAWAREHASVITLPPLGDRMPPGASP